MPSWSVVVPAKRLVVAKTRLRPLTEALGVAHGELVLALLADTVSAALASPAVGEVVVVTDDPDAAEVVRGLGARTVADLPDRGLNPALAHGARNATGPAVAALSSDLPALRPAELAAALAAALASPRFGPGSAQAHRASGAVELTGAWPGLVRDVDTEADLRAALALGAGPRTRALAVHLRAAP